MHYNTTVTIRYGLWIALQIVLGLLSTVVLYWFISHAFRPLGAYTSLQIRNFIYIVVSLLFCETILWFPQRLLEKHRWLVLFALVGLSTSYNWIESSTYLPFGFIVFYALASIFYLIRYQWRFISEKTYYDLLLGPVFVWVFCMSFVISLYDYYLPEEHADDIAQVYAFYIIPTLFIYPGLFPKEKMKSAVLFSLALIALCFGIISNREFMGFLVDGRKDLFLAFPNTTLIIIGTLYIILIFSSFLGRCLYYGHVGVKCLWKNRQNLMKYRFSDKST